MEVFIKKIFCLLFLTVIVTAKAEQIHDRFYLDKIRIDKSLLHLSDPSLKEDTSDSIQLIYEYTITWPSGNVDTVSYPIGEAYKITPKFYTIKSIPESSLSYQYSLHEITLKLNELNNKIEELTQLVKSQTDYFQNSFIIVDSFTTERKEKK